MIERGELPGKLLKRAAFVGRASKAQILELIEELYGGYDRYRPGTRLDAQFQELVAYANALLDDKEYALSRPTFDGDGGMGALLAGDGGRTAAAWATSSPSAK